MVIIDLYNHAPEVAVEYQVVQDTSSTPLMLWQDHDCKKKKSKKYLKL